MKIQVIFSILFLAIFLSFSACKPCNECNDPKLVKISSTDSSKPTIQWSFSSARTTPGSATSSISIVTDPATGVNANIANNLSYGVYVEGTDNESGIKSIKMSGGFSNICRNGAGLISTHGIIGEQNQNFSFTNCALKSWSLNDLKVESYADCGSSFTLDHGDASFKVVVENFAGLKDSSVLSVHFRPAGL